MTPPAIPRHVAWVVGLGLLSQVFFQALQPPPRATGEGLPRPPQPVMLRLASLGEPEALARVLMLRLLSLDYQSGAGPAYREMDFARLEEWLERLLALDPRGQVPLIAASRLYADVSDPVRRRRMLNFIHRMFHADPARRWPWLAHAVIVARYGMGDPALALAFAGSLKRAGGEIPSWAREME